MSSVLRALWRYGGILVQPRPTMAALPPSEGLRDGLWLGLLYVLVTGTYGLLQAVATALATANLGGIVMLLGALGRTMVAPILLLVACETILGRRRAYRRGLFLVPLVVAASVAHELGLYGIDLPPFAPEIVGSLAGLALVWWVRPEVTPHDASEGA